jgi:GMP synthase-like glutamine amidotransferase
MNALICLHHPEEGPGLLKDILRQRGWEVREAELWKGEQIPDSRSFHLLILMGGPMSVNDEDSYPFLREEKAFVRSWITDGSPTLGICMGAQLIANCLGARVYRGDKEELGWYELMITGEGIGDPFLSEFPPRFPVFQWHGETFDLPDSAKLLAAARDYPHQAFRLGDLTYAFQFHLEVTEEMLQAWLSHNAVSERRRKEINSSRHLHLPLIHTLCRSFMKRFLAAIEHRTGAEI